MGTQMSLDVGLSRLHPTKRATLARRIAAEWQQDSACADAKDPDAWFPPSQMPYAEMGEPLRVCVSCPVRRSCLAAALLRQEAGIWAGTTVRDRTPAIARLAAGARTDDVLDELLYMTARRARGAL
jgi:hypothetical protein